MRNVYIINLSFGVAGTERRMANVWNTLRRRGNVKPYLVVPEPLADVLVERGLADAGDPTLWTVPDSFLGRFVHLDVVSRYNNVLAHLRSRIVARNYQPIWERISSDTDPVIHVGLDTSPLNPPDVPIVYECMDSTLKRLEGHHYVKAAARYSVINCQTDRIRSALEQNFADRSPRWTTVTSPNYFASYPDTTQPSGQRDPMLVVFVGRLIAGKNPLVFVEALGRLRAMDIPVRGLILGFGTQEDAVRRRIAELALDDVIGIEHTALPSRFLREASIYVSLQSGDNYGSQSLLEAMGSGCAILASDVGDTRRLITTEVGLLTSFDVDDVAEKLRDMLVKPERTAQQGRAAEAVARDQYNADSYAIFLEGLYDLAVSKHRQAP